VDADKISESEYVSVRQYHVASIDTFADLSLQDDFENDA
jgi:hypothetical protein